MQSVVTGPAPLFGPLPPDVREPTPQDLEAGKPDERVSLLLAKRCELGTAGIAPVLTKPIVGEPQAAQLGGGNAAIIDKVLPPQALDLTFQPGRAQARKLGHGADVDVQRI